MKISLIIAMLILSTSVFAKQGQGRGQGCRAEVMELCGDHRGDHEAMKSCIAQNKDNFSEQCKNRVGEGKMKGKHADCPNK